MRNWIALIGLTFVAFLPLACGSNNSPAQPGPTIIVIQYPTSTNTPIPTATPVLTNTFTNTPTNTATITPTYTATNTPTITPTCTPIEAQGFAIVNGSDSSGVNVTNQATLYNCCGGWSTYSFPINGFSTDGSTEEAGVFPLELVTHGISSYACTVIQASDCTGVSMFIEEFPNGVSNPPVTINSNVSSGCQGVISGTF
jgi:hypothetical protein